MASPAAHFATGPIADVVSGSGGGRILGVTHGNALSQGWRSQARALLYRNGVPIAALVSLKHADAAARHPTTFEDHPEGIARDRWDVAIETTDDTVLVECGAIRERVSQELARAIFDAVKRAVEARDSR